MHYALEHAPLHANYQPVCTLSRPEMCRRDDMLDCFQDAGTSGWDLRAPGHLGSDQPGEVHGHLQVSIRGHGGSFV
jgi:hypothetical protein